MQRDIVVYWHTGESGSGKSYEAVKLAETHSEDNIYIVGEFERGFDKYNGEKILFLDEYRGQIKYEHLLTIIGGLKVQMYARYTNVIGLWTEVHITSVYSPDILYQDMIRNNRKIDTYEQLRRRISYMEYRYKHNGGYYKFELPMSEYVNYGQLKDRAYMAFGISPPATIGFTGEELPADTPTPFDSDEVL